MIHVMVGDCGVHKHTENQYRDVTEFRKGYNLQYI
jgi:hypothetical protein